MVFGATRERLHHTALRYDTSGIATLGPNGTRISRDNADGFPRLNLYAIGPMRTSEFWGSDAGVGLASSRGDAAANCIGLICHSTLSRKP